MGMRCSNSNNGKISKYKRGKKGEGEDEEEEEEPLLLASYSGRRGKNVIFLARQITMQSLCVNL